MNRLFLLLVGLPIAACSASSGAGAPTGEAVFRRCAICHRIGANEGNGMGPNLHGVVGRKAGSLPDFTYSPAMRGAGWVWDEKRLDRFLSDPQHVVPGTRMSFSGLADPASRKAVIDFLKRNSPKP